MGSVEALAWHVVQSNCAKELPEWQVAQSMPAWTVPTSGKNRAWVS